MRHGGIFERRRQFPGRFQQRDGEFVANAAQCLGGDALVLQSDVLSNSTSCGTASRSRRRLTQWAATCFTVSSRSRIQHGPRTGFRAVDAYESPSALRRESMLALCASRRVSAPLLAAARRRGSGLRYDEPHARGSPRVLRGFSNRPPVTERGPRVASGCTIDSSDAAVQSSFSPRGSSIFAAPLRRMR